VAPVGERDEGRLPPPSGHPHGGGHHAVADPDRRVAGEHEVGQRVDGELVGAVHAPDQRVLPVAQLAEADPADEDVPQLGGSQRGQLGAHPRRELASEDALVHRVGDAPFAGPAVVEGGPQEVGEAQDADPVAGEGGGEAVVLELRARDPRDAVEQEPVGVAGGEALELGARAVEDDGPQRADLGVHARRGHGRRPYECGRNDTFPTRSAEPTNATTSISACAPTCGHRRPVRCQYRPNTRPMTTLPSPPPRPW
jgi:hypothetical protein